MKILLDPGHGGDDPGAVYDGVREKDITLAVALRATNVLRSLNHDVFLTRDRDMGIPLRRRLELANEYQAEAFISLHCNASATGGPGPQGIETYYRDDRDRPLAECLQRILASYTGRKDIGIHQDIARLGKRLAVLNNYELPAALVEIGYLSNPDDRGYLIDNINTLGELVAHGVDWYAHLAASKEKERWPT